VRCKATRGVSEIQKVGELYMESFAGGGVINGVAPILILLLVGTGGGRKP